MKLLTPLVVFVSVYANIVYVVVTDIVMQAIKTSLASSVIPSATISEQEVVVIIVTPSSGSPVLSLPSIISPSLEPSYVQIYSQISNTGADEQYSRAILDAHNSKRAIHHVGNLSWNSTLYRYAQDYANKYDCSGILQHSGGPYGENLIAGTDLHTGTDAALAWYSEIDSYNWTNQNQYNHFTAMVWKSTTQLGCAYKNCQLTNWGYYTVCEYSEAVPNLVGAAKENVIHP